MPELPVKQPDGTHINARTGELTDDDLVVGMTADEVAQSKAQMEADHLRWLAAQLLPNIKRGLVGIAGVVEYDISPPDEDEAAALEWLESLRT